MGQHRRHLRNYLLDSRFQLRFAVVILLLATALTAGLGAFWYDEMRKASRIVEVKALSTMSDEEVKKIEADMAREDHKRLGILVGFGGLLVVTLAGFSIIFTHRVAGPLHKISRHMHDISENDLKEVWDIRKGDQLQAFWQVFKGMHTSLRQRQLQDLATLKEAVTVLKARELEVPRALEQLIEEKMHSLGESKDSGGDRAA